ncbi:MAG TPA: helicase-related protein [Methylovirgula sp.]|nr:helicase-related protein [Methylovirgula sp.]
MAAFNSDPMVRVMVANDAAGEGVNLQRGTHLMVNYDLPWNPNRLEQRFGRIHRIGQTEVCHLWNLCAANTREGEVYRRLLEKLEEARAALGGKVYDVLGELFEGHALRDLLVDAIRYGDRPETKAELFRKVDGVVDVDAIEKLVAERKLTSEGMDPHAVSEIREQMERAQARRLQPHFIGAFFREAFTMLGGRISEREKGRFEITSSPASRKRSSSHLAIPFSKRWSMSSSKDFSRCLSRAVFSSTKRIRAPTHAFSFTWNMQSGTAELRVRVSPAPSLNVSSSSSSRRTAPPSMADRRLISTADRSRPTSASSRPTPFLRLGFQVRSKAVRSDMPSNLWCRSIWKR